MTQSMLGAVPAGHPMENTTKEPSKINLVSLLGRTIGKVMVSAGIEESEASVRMVTTCLVNIAADYVRTLGDDPKHIEALFHAFLTGTEKEQKAAVKAFGEAFDKRIVTPDEL